MFLMNVFCALITATATPATVTPLWGSEPVGPGETALLFGEGMSNVTTVEMALAGGSEPESWVELEPIQVSDRSVKVVIPKDWKIGVYAWRAESRTSGSLVNGQAARSTTGNSRKAFLNRPHLWWVQGDDGTTASPGGWLRAFGKCLAFEGSTPKVILRNRQTKRELPLISDETSPYALKASIPADLAEGHYEVLVHNGLGGGWSREMELEVRQSAPWPDTLFNVVEFGAVGNDGKDDTEAIRKAIEAARKAGGGVVYFPRGRYRLSGELHLPRFVVLKGERQELVMLYWDDTDSPPEALIRGTDSFGIENLTIACANYVHVIVGNMGSDPNSGDVFIKRVRVRVNIYLHLKTPQKINERFMKAPEFGSSHGGDLIRLGGRNVEITDSDLYGSGRALFLSKVRSGYVARNTFYNGRWGWYSISGSDRLIFERNDIIGGDLMSTGGGLNCLDGSAYSQNVYFAHNVFRNLFGWDREAMTSDAGGGAYLGGVDSCDGTKLVLSDDAAWQKKGDWKGAAVFILGGKGAGQYRRIVRYKGRAIELERPWDVEPDATSEVSVTMFHNHYLIIGNEFYDATIAVQFYGNSIEHIVAQNQSTRAGGFHNLGLLYAGGVQPSWFVQYLDNEILEGNGLKGPLNQYPPLDSHIAVMGHQTPEHKSPLTRCTVIRRNRLHNNARIEVGGFCEDVVIEHNSIENSDVGISVEKTAKGVLFRENSFLNVTTPHE